MSARVYRVGLTGGIASGKSTAAKFFGALGVPILDSDQIARDVVEPGQPPLERLVARFGPHDPHRRRPPRPPGAARHRLRRPEGACRPRGPHAPGDRRRARGALGERRAALPDPGGAAAGREKPRRATSTACSSWTATRRCRSAGSPAATAPRAQQAQAILDAQATRATRLKAADDVISNEADMSAVQSQVAALHARYLELAAQPRG